MPELDGYSEIAPVWILSGDFRMDGARVFGAFDSPEAAMKYFQIKLPMFRYLDWVQADREYEGADKAFVAKTNALDTFTIQQFDVLSDEEIA
jgi:hypothetical protein